MLSTPWCLTHMQDMFNNPYGNGGRDKIYFIYHDGFENIEAEPNQEPTWDVPKTGEPPYDAFGYSLICIIVNEEGKLTYCTPRWNHTYPHVDDFLNEKEISKLIQDDFYSVFIPYSKEEADEREESGEFGDSEDDWSDYLIYASDGYEIGYFRGGTLYDMDRIEIQDGYINDYASMKTYQGAITIPRVHQEGLDVFEITERGELRKSFEKVNFIQYPEFVEDFTMIGIDKDRDFVFVNLENFDEFSIGRGIYYYKHLENEFYLLYYEDKKHYGIVNINTQEEIVYGIIDPDRIEFDNEEEMLYFWEYEQSCIDNSFSWLKKRISWNAYEGDWEYADNDEYYEDEEIRESKNNWQLYTI